MLKAVTQGRPGTAMKSFAGVLSPEDIALVVDFVRQEFMRDKAVNTRYHTAENGWPNHEQYAPAYPFATGKISIDTPSESLSAEQRLGKQLFMQSCVTCHDRARVKDEGVIWDARPVSYPRNHYSPAQQADPVDAQTSATPYARHDVVPVFSDLSPQEQEGERLFQGNCAFCHGADGTGKNWIGSFLEPHPRNLTDPAFMQTLSKSQLAERIREGLPGTTMPAWKSVLNDRQIDAVVAYVSRAFHPLRDGK